MGTSLGPVGVAAAAAAAASPLSSRRAAAVVMPAMAPDCSTARAAFLGSSSRGGGCGRNSRLPRVMAAVGGLDDDLVMDPNDGFKMKRPDELSAGTRRGSMLSPSQQANRDAYIAEYEEIKNKMLTGSAKAVGAASVYVFLSNTPQAAAGTALGGVTGLAYLYMFQQYVDGLDEGDEKLKRAKEAKEIQDFYRRTISRVGAAATLALKQKRFLLPVALAASSTLYNALSPDAPVPTWSLFLGFMMYKAGVWGRVYEDGVKKSIIQAIIKDDLGDLDKDKPSRPVMKKLLAEEELDVYGRPVYTPPPIDDDEEEVGGGK